jgi:hypothetical protein
LAVSVGRKLTPDVEIEEDALLAGGDSAVTIFGEFGKVPEIKVHG